jgi:organic hydroperoxide reductase OsmC/OhrA
LHVSSRLPEREDEKFHKAARAAKASCPISRVLNLPIRMSAKLEPVEEPAMV